MDFEKGYRIGKFTTSKKEIVDLVKAWLIVSVAFSLALSGFSSKFLESLIISLIVVATGFLLHELGHKIVAQRYGYFAEFRSFDQMLILALIMSLFGFVFAAPGAVMIRARSMSVEKNGKISVAGPLVNLVLAALFLVLLHVTSNFPNTIASYGLKINAWLALFNLIPVWQFDGAKIWRWNKVVWFLIGIAALGLMFSGGF